MIQPVQNFSGSLRNQKKKSLSIHGQFVPEYSNISKRYFLCFNDDYYKL